MNSSSHLKSLFSLFILLLGLQLDVVAEAEKPYELPVVKNDAAGFRETLLQLKQLREQGAKGQVVIEIPAGNYQFEKTVQLTPELVGNGLTLKAKQKQNVVFSGGLSLGKGSRDSQGNWRFPLPEESRQHVAPRSVIINDQLQRPARFPNQGPLRIEKSLEDRRSGFIVAEGDLPADFELTGSSEVMCDLIFMHDWSSSRLPVASYQSKSRELRTVGPIGCAAKHYAIDHFEKQPRYWLEGHPQFADLPGEWYVDLKSQEIVVVASPDEKQPPNVILPRLMEVFTASGTDEKTLQDLSVQGITFTGTVFPMPAGGVAGAQATMHEPRDAQGKRTTTNRPMLRAAVKLELAENCSFMDCKFHALGGTAVWLAGQTQNCRIVNCNIEHVGGNGINLGEDNSRRVQGKTWFQSAPQQIPTGNKVERCQISFCGEMLPGSVGIWAALQKRLDITGNHIHDTPYTGISLGWIWSQTPSPAGENKIRNNHIEFVMQVLSDGGGIYTLGRQPGSIIENNTITDVPLNAGRAESNGMFLDQGSTGFTIRNNTIRRIDRSPLRFHQAGKNRAENNRWDLATDQTPPVRFNNTPEENIEVVDNTVLPAQKQIYLIGNSLTWDTIPSMLDERVLWHVDCGKTQKYIQDHPENPCVASSRIWPLALRSTQFDVICFQPHYGNSLEEDIDAISSWIAMQHKATIVIHTGWARSATLLEEWKDDDPAGKATHSTAYYDELLNRLQEKFPKRTFRSTHAMNYLHQIEQDIQAGKAPYQSLEEIYRDAIHMKMESGRYLMHNVVRKTLGQPPQSNGFPPADPKIKAYLDELLKKDFN